MCCRSDVGDDAPDADEPPDLVDSDTEDQIPGGRGNGGIALELIFQIARANPRNLPAAYRILQMSAINLAASIPLTRLIQASHNITLHMDGWPQQQPTSGQQQQQASLSAAERRILAPAGSSSAAERMWSALTYSAEDRRAP